MLHHINTKDFEFAIENGIYKLIEKMAEIYSK